MFLSRIGSNFHLKYLENMLYKYDYDNLYEHVKMQTVVHAHLDEDLLC